LNLLLKERVVGPALAIAFLFLAMAFGGLLATITPPGQVADETAHSLRAYAVGRGDLVGHRGKGADGHVHAGVNADAALVVIGSAFDQNDAGQIYFAPSPPKKFDMRKYNLVRTQDWQGPSFWSLGNIAVYVPVFYVPAGLAIQSARVVFGASPFHALIAGRLVNLFCFTVLGVIALLTARHGRGLIFCALLLPMALSLAVSVNPDGLLIAAAALAAALISRALDQDPSEATEPSRSPAYWFAALLIALIVMTKLPYFPIAAMLLLPLPGWGDWARHRRAVAQRLGIACLAILPALIWTTYGVLYISAPYPRSVYPAGPLWPGPWPMQFDATAPVAQLQVLLSYPWQLLTLPWGTLMRDSRAMIPMVIGVLGPLTIPIPSAVYSLWLVALASGATADSIGNRGRAISVRLADMALLFSAAIGCVWAIYLSQYLLWTNVGAAHIEGAQGRYFIPLIPMLALALPRFGLAGGNLLRVGLLLIPIAVAAADLILVPPTLIRFWYAPVAP
jgi:hypothetical protein